MVPLCADPEQLLEREDVEEGIVEDGDERNDADKAEDRNRRQHEQPCPVIKTLHPVPPSSVGVDTRGMSRLENSLERAIFNKARKGNRRTALVDTPIAHGNET